MRLTLLLTMTLALPASAQVPDTVTAMLHRIFASPDFFPERFGPARWIENGTAYTTVERSKDVDGASDIVRYETATGARSVYISASRLVPSGATEALDFDDYAWSADGNLLLLFTNTQRVWRQNTRGDYWVLNRQTGALKKLGGPNAPPSTLMYAKFSPTGDRVAYVRQGNVYVERLSDGAITELTSDADSLHVNGMTDWVYEEEFSLRDAFRWSPDGAKIAFWHFDMTGVGTFTLINDTDSLYPKTIPIQYPKAGTKNSAVTAGVVSANGGPTTWLKIPDDPRENYLPWMEWAGPNELLLQRMNRPQNTDRVMLADATTGATRDVVVERDSAWIELVDDIQWLAKGTEFLWPSERDGWQHIYRVSRDGKRVTNITPGNFDVVSVAGVDEAGGWLYYIASPDNATQRYLYRTKLNGKGSAPPERVSPAAQAGTHSYRISPDERWAFHTYSSFRSPSVIELVQLPEHRVVRTLVDNAKQRAAVAPYVKGSGEFFKVPVSGGITLDGWMIKPANFDSTKSYPLLMYVYGEPAGQTAQDSWGGGHLWEHTIADQGYIVATVDNRGTPAPRGRAWRKVVYGAVGILSSREQADAVRTLTSSRRYLDPTRVAIWGWSGGGSSTLQAMFRYPDVYAVGMSVAPVPEERLYDTIYQERYMGLLNGPADSARYYNASAISKAEGLKGRLLIVHGSGDDNVHYQGTERLVNRLVTLGKSFDFMAYPNRSHCICEGRGTTLHVYTLLTRYLMEHLAAGPRPRSAMP
jgi:dipeptidyl-peptidase-4